MWSVDPSSIRARIRPRAFPPSLGDRVGHAQARVRVSPYFFFTYDDLRKSTYLDAIVRDVRVIGFSPWKILGNPLISSPYKTGKVRICPLGMSKSRAGIRPDEFQTGVPRRETASTETDETSGVPNQFRRAMERSKSSPWLLSFSFSPLFIFLHK